MSAAVEQSRRKANMVAQGQGKFGPVSLLFFLNLYPDYDSTNIITRNTFVSASKSQRRRKERDKPSMNDTTLPHFDKYLTYTYRICLSVTLFIV